jgi:hypothetical protein
MLKFNRKNFPNAVKDTKLKKGGDVGKALQPFFSSQVE